MLTEIKNHYQPETFPHLDEPSAAEADQKAKAIKINYRPPAVKKIS